uniref:Uncharacterized protein n=1 Tax=Rhizophora mucronata TaxID=61149 RepID=A0A2P2QII3_RHIMU
MFRLLEPGSHPIVVSGNLGVA